MLKKNMLHIYWQRASSDRCDLFPYLAELMYQPFYIGTRRIDELGDFPLRCRRGDLLLNGLHFEQETWVVLIDEGSQLSGDLLGLVEKLDDVGVLTFIDLRKDSIFEHVDRLKYKKDRLNSNNGLCKVVSLCSFLKNCGIGQIHRDQISPQTPMLDLHIFEVMANGVSKLDDLLL